MQILRGLREPSPSPLEQEQEQQQERRSVEDEARDRERREHRERQRKRRRLGGENDTDRDIRLAREDVEGSRSRRGGDSILLRRPTSDAPLVDEAGRINLFPVEEKEKRDKRGQKNPEAEAETARKNREFEDQYTMRFANAAGYKRGMEKPWYSSSGLDLAQETGAMPTKDVWGNEDPRRREREKARTDANDPLAAMRKGVRQLRAVEQERRKWEDERRRELDALKEEQREERRRRRRRHRSRSRSPARSAESLEDFRLDDCVEDKERRRKHRSHRDREDREYRSDRSRHRSKHRPRRSDG